MKKNKKKKSNKKKKISKVPLKNKKKILEAKQIAFLENKLKLEYETFAPTFRTIGDNLRMNIKLKSEQNSSKLVNLLNKNSRLIHFKEVIPNVNEIFINSVQND